MNFKIKDLKVLFENKRYRSALILLLYVIFFIVVISLVRTSVNSPSPVPTVTKSSYEVFCELANYEYKMVYNNNGEEFEVNGKTFRTDSYFKVDSNEYYIKNGKTYLLPNIDEDITLDFDYYDIPTICQLIDNGKLVGKNEDLEAGLLVKKYLVQDEKNSFYISTNEKDNEISVINIEKIDKDDEEANTYTIDIGYSNINKVSNFTSMFNDLVNKKEVEETSEKEIEEKKEEKGVEE